LLVAAEAAVVLFRYTAVEEEQEQGLIVYQHRLEHLFLKVLTL
jgi:hypothetical protein